MSQEDLEALIARVDENNQVEEPARPQTAIERILGG